MPYTGKSTSNEEITLRIEVSLPPTQYKNVFPSELDICWLLCAQESINAPRTGTLASRADAELAADLLAAGTVSKMPP
ncbi:hypothetical protein B0J13DRAFT_623432 [Dactylonectria estremocensis]|uniref:Uncharacterized protein n=1 Tax=Dactylonectria estremocensis TaxID=1079267 RepID=A0A9P9ESR7_9HYPO|nr:hypothetical protein B0J13DRAFT_623432 [Dactylonectria estremocensis]